MASSSARPSICHYCGALPEYNKQGFAIGYWMYQSKFVGNKVIWYTICPDCYEMG